MSKGNSGLFVGTKGDKQANQTSKPLLNKNLSKEQNELIQEVIDKGFKISPEKVLGIGKMTDGKIVWIEEGKLGEKASGLAHIWEKRGSDFTARGISKEEIPEFIINAVTIGTKLGIQGNQKAPRDVFEYNYKGVRMLLAVSISSNGYIVGANFTNESRIKKEK